jgi:hypothetical protein
MSQSNSRDMRAQLAWSGRRGRLIKRLPLLYSQNEQDLGHLAMGVSQDHMRK